MNRTKHSRLATRSLLLLVTLILLFASTASAEWKEKVLYSFQGGTDGSTPAGGVVFDSAGNLYGVTSDGGGVYQLAPPTKQGGAWTESVLYVFQGNTKGDGATPEGGLVIDSAGNLYGTTAYGGTGNCVLLGIWVGCGTVFELSPPAQKGGAWTETVLYSFPTAKQGYFPWGSLVFDSAGNLYGATQFGGGFGTCDQNIYLYCGAVFKLSPPKTKGGWWRENVLYGFKGVAAGAPFGDGANPNGGLVFDSNGAIYGTTFIGGYNCPHNSGQGCGTAFELKPPTKKGGTWTENVLHRFDRSSSDGGNPSAGLVLDGKHNLYGTTLNGGPGLYGTVFRLAPQSGKSGSWTETILYGFKDNDKHGADPMAGLIFDATGDLYGTTNGGGGRFAGGNVFRMKPSVRKQGTWTLNAVHTFTGNPDGNGPAAAPILDKLGNLYGTTQDGGTGTGCSFQGCGTVFEVSP